jgi:hypothetical protein
MTKMVRILEPRLEFAFDQAVEDPRDEFTLFGPYDRATGAAYGIKAGVIGTPKGIVRFKQWVESIQRPVGIADAERFRPPFPGFEPAFQIPWRPDPTLEMVCHHPGRGVSAVSASIIRSEGRTSSCERENEFRPR